MVLLLSHDADNGNGIKGKEKKHVNEKGARNKINRSQRNSEFDVLNCLNIVSLLRGHTGGGTAFENSPRLFACIIIP